jgi:dTDP-4-amino-4,6-dideoxygalactose transaminase
VTPHDELRRAIGERVGVPPGHVALFWRGRVAMYAILRALGIGPGDEVIVPAFTCVAVPNAVLYAGATPVYVDIDEATYTPDPAAVAAAIGPRTRAVMAQNTFGLSSDLDALAASAAQHGAVVIDDCTHGLGGTYKGRPNGSAALAAFFSTQWSKPISTGLGGIAVTTDSALARELAAFERAAAEPGVRDRALLGAMLLVRERVATPRTLRAGRAVYRAASRAGLVPGSSSGGELTGTRMPASFHMGMSALQARLGAQRLATIDARLRRRRAVAEHYSACLESHGLSAAREPSFARHGFLRYPLRVDDRERLIAQAARRGVLLGDWFRSPVHPIEGDLSPWGYRAGSNPIAERVAQEIVNLPTDLAAGGRELPVVEELLEGLARDR